MPGPTVYIETTIPSYYFETRTTARAVAWREATRQWWNRHRAGYSLVTSSFVLNELALAPAAKSAPGASLLAGRPILESSPEVERIAGEYIRRRVMPASAVGDAAHLAACSLHGVNFLLTWNCKHLANANKASHIRFVNEQLGLSVPILTTPLELVPEDAS
ncbi:MAG TPA: type II toxin-antitoxin system VapC family toxin [Phycisphaerales bacterium]|nr:type II toxin-antitoxin system VapC family toxin [Phycisphaerales bacterium]